MGNRKVKSVLCAFLLLFNLQIGAASTSTTADYVVVGLGTSGSVLVNKLTKDKKNSVIALHQGKKFSYEKLVRYFKNELLIGSTPLLTQFESVWPLLGEEWRQQLTLWINLNKVLHSRFYETGETTIQEYASHRKFMWEYPSMAGGISSVNGGVWCRGSNEAYSEWGRIAGTKWSLGRLQSMFKWLETFSGDTHSGFRGSRGVLNILQMPSTKIGEVFSEAIVNA
ncbi:MAG: GMC family oxidoreductase N-terminal domain-containing protein, partial [Parachlamydiaceae bacterium]